MTQLSERPCTIAEAVPGFAGYLRWKQAPEEALREGVILPPGAHLSASSGNLYDAAGRLYYSPAAVADREAWAASMAAHQANGGDCFPDCGCEDELDPFGLPLAYLNVVEGRPAGWLAALTPDQLVAARCAIDLARGWLEDLERNLTPLVAALPPAVSAESTARYREVWDW
jgi:hypothetical protein